VRGNALKLAFRDEFTRGRAVGRMEILEEIIGYMNELKAAKDNEYKGKGGEEALNRMMRDITASRII